MTWDIIAANEIIVEEVHKAVAVNEVQVKVMLRKGDNGFIGESSIGGGYGLSHNDKKDQES